MKLVFFVKEDCEACKNAKEKVTFFLDKWGASDSVPIEAINLDTEDGLVEAAMSGAAEVPTLIIHDDTGGEARWEKKAPPSDELRAKLGL